MDPDRHTPPRTGQDVPDAALFWRWAGRAGRPAVGWILVGAGALAILIGYFGLADRVLVAEQLPYLISGGIGGIALVIVGGVILATNDGRRDADRLDDIEDEIAELRALVVDLHRALLRRPDNPDNDNGDQQTVSRPASRRSRRDRVYAVASGATFHRDGCAVLVDKGDVERLAPATARRRGLTPCALCEPQSSA